MNPTIPTSSAALDKLSALAAKLRPHAQKLGQFACQQWRKQGRALQIVMGLLLGGAFFGGLGGLLVVNHYDGKAKAYDLSLLQEKGALRVLDRNGTFMGTLDPKNRVPLVVMDLPPYVVSALLATEDTRFFEHSGVDYRGIVRAACTNLVAGGQVKQGGSTITQQLARQVFELRGRTLDRKLTEVFLAFRIERSFSKEAILERYLNEVYFGNGYHGLGAASLGYLGKTAKNLTMAEAATLVGIIRSPVRYAPTRAPADALRLRNVVLKRMAVTGKADEEAINLASKEPLKLAHANATLYKQGYALAALNRELLSRDSSANALSQLVYSSIDSRLQQRLLRMVREHVEGIEKAGGKCSKGVQAAAIVLDNASGEILAIAGGSDYAVAPFDRAMQAKRAPGTMFLPVVAATVAAGDPKRLMNDVLDAPLDNRKVMVGGDSGTLAEWGGFTPVLYHEGMVPAGYAFVMARTGAMMRLGSEVGMDAVAYTALQLGIQAPLSKYPNAILGSSPVSLVEMAHAFTAFANDGRLAPRPHLMKLEQIKGAVEDGLPTLAARQLRALMMAYLQQTEMTPALERAGLADKGLAGYAGSSYGGRDAWFIGCDRNVTCAVWVGRDDNQPLPARQNLADLTVPLWAEAMKEATQGRPQGFSDGKMARAICLRSGEPAITTCHECGLCLTDASFIPNSIHSACHLHEPTATLAPIAITRMAEQPGGPLPQAARSVTVRSAVVIGEDPYRQSMAKVMSYGQDDAQESQVSAVLGKP